MMMPSPQAAIQDAFVAWMLDAPPIARLCPEPISFEAVCVGDVGNWPAVLINGAHYPIVGVSPSHWLSIAGRGWRFFDGNADDFLITSAACNSAQAAHLSKRGWVEDAMRRVNRRCEPNPIGGLSTIETGDGRHWIRLEDIIRIDVRTAFDQYLSAHGSEGTHYFQYKLGAYKIDETYAGAEAWWRFARAWGG